MMSARPAAVTRLTSRALLVLALLAGCARHHLQVVGPEDAGFETLVAGGEWSLLDLNGHVTRAGAAGRRPTIGFDGTSGRATGFAGCNEYRVSFIAHGDSLKFEPPVSTHYACTVGLDVERAFLNVLAATRSYRLSDGDLLLLGADGVLARFARGGN